MTKSVQQCDISYFELVYSVKGPQGGWQETGEGGKERILKVGLFEMGHKGRLNAFLLSQHLPPAIQMMRPEASGISKSCLVLTVSMKTWEQKIRPIQENYAIRRTEFIAAYVKGAAI